ncbi:MAG: ParA family protein [Chromatiaceae bacterium]|nr:ParA family protein [Gammaproteobacteria bacterium]MCP5446202.1 ParA family protein [Chromatiaceae bacterium]MCB1860968.1 ParA family protein [Gammaproteobacteria bacterium]MCB1871410.1 ParA family protein [Gammaproteobacteria bacterium]MCB1879465.1 ParA family protein [Gammaproteobacteria bacterium]
MKVWTLANQKGGVGKTTSAVSLGGLLACWGFRTLVMDIDPHGSLTSYFRYDPETLESGAFSLFEAAMKKQSVDPYALVRATDTEGLDLLPASVALATLDRQAGRQEGMGLVLKNAMSALAPHYDHVIIDCPPMLGVLLINALAACERLLIPVQTEYLALKGLERMLHTLQMVLRARTEFLPHLIVPTMFDRRTRASIDSLKILRSDHAAAVWRGAIPIDTKFRDASRAGIPPSLFDPHARGVAAYTTLLEQLQGRPAIMQAAG